MNKYTVFIVFTILFSYCSNSIANMGAFPEGMFRLSEEDKLLLSIIAGISIILGLIGTGVLFKKYKKIKIWLFTPIISIAIFTVSVSYYVFI